MAELLNEQELRTEISNLKTYWNPRNKKFEEWYKLLVMVDMLESPGLESYVSNEPQTFYDMAHYLLTRGELSHSTPVSSESALELDKKAKIDRGCKYNWSLIDRERQLGGGVPFLDELGFFLLVLGWHAEVFMFDQETGLLKAQVWNPYETYPHYANGKMIGCLHSYEITEKEAKEKAQANYWDYKGFANSAGKVFLDDYWAIVDGVPYNIVLFDGKPVHNWTDRPNMRVLAAPVAGFPDRGSLSPGGYSWKKLMGRSIFEVNETVSEAFNKWKTMVSQVLRDTAQPITQEFSASPQATPEQLRERGALFHYGVGEQGLQRVPPAAIPIEIQAHLMEMRRELQKGSFNDAVWGMMENQSGYALSEMASSSANQILYPYMDAKHFVIGSGDEFWLSKLKSSRRVFEIKGKFIEKLKPTDIPDDVNVIVESDVATAKNWLERGTIANYLKEHLDEATLLREVLKQPDPQAIIRQKRLDGVLDSQEAQAVRKIAGFKAHARYLRRFGDREQADLFEKAAAMMEAQLGAPAPGQAELPEMSRVNAQREAGAPKAKPTARPEVAPPEARGGFTPQQLRNAVGQGRIVRR